MKKIICIILLLSGLCGRGNTILAQDVEPQNYVLLLNSANFSVAWSDILLVTFVEQMQNQGVSLVADNLLVPLMRTPDDASKRCEELLQKYPHPPKAVILVGDPGWIAIRPLFDNEWKDIPTIVCYSREMVPSTIQGLLSRNVQSLQMVPFEKVTEGYNVTILRQPTYVRETVNVMRKLLPNLKSVAFISDHRYISVSIRDEVREVMQQHFPDLKFVSLSTPEHTTEQLLDLLAGYDHSVGILYYSWFVTDNSHNASYLDDNIQKVLFGFSRTPIFTLSDRCNEGSNFAGGHFILAEEFSKTLISTMRKILSGTRAEDIEWSDGGKPATYLNYTHLEHHAIPRTLYPQDAIYIQAPPSFLSKYKFHIISAVSLLILLIAGVSMRLYFYIQKHRQRDREFRMLSRYRKLLNNMPIIYIRKKLLDTNNDYVFLDVNSSFESVFECTSQQVVGRQLSELLPLFPKMQCLVYSFKTTESITLTNSRGEVRHYDKLVFSGTDKDVRDVFCIENTAEYMAKLRMEQNHRALETLHEKYRLVLRSTGLTPWTWDIEAQQIDCNLEYTPNLLEGTGSNLIVDTATYYNLIHPDDCDQVKNAYDDLKAGRTEILMEEYRVIYIPVSQSYCWTRSYAVVSERDANGQAKQIVGASFLIEEQKQFEQELLSAKDKAEESNRLKSAFLANMSHEIRTPLNAIVGFSNLVCNCEISDEREAYMRIVEENNELLLKLISDVLDLSRIESGSFEFMNDQIDVNSLCCDVISSLGLKVNSKQLELRFGDHLPECIIQSDKGRLSQVLINFLNNATKFTPSGHITLSYSVNGDRIRFSVCDTGPGIPDELLQPIFGRFVKLNSFAQGTGLGLAICKSIVEQMHGSIGVESQVGEGSCFWFEIPISS